MKSYTVAPFVHIQNVRYRQVVCVCVCVLWTENLHNSQNIYGQKPVY